MFKSTILDRYITRELLPPFFLSIAVLTLALFLQRMFRLMELILSKGSSLAETGKLVLYIMPGFLVMTLPMSLLVAALTAFARLSADSEVTAMKASRVSLYAMVRPVMQFAVVLFLVTAVIAHFLAPHATYAFKAQLFTMLKNRAMVGLEQGVFSSTFDGMVLYVDRMSSLDDIQGIFISDERSGSEPFTIVAKQGRLIANPENLNVTLVMEQGAIHLQPRTENIYSLMSFDTGRLFIDISRASLRRRSDDGGRSIDEMDSLELYRELRRVRAKGEPVKAIEIELQKRVSISYACLIFGLIGAPLGIRKGRTGRSAGIAISLFVILAYYLVLGAAIRLADSGALSPLTATWVPNGLITLAAVALVVMKGTEVTFGIGRRAGALAYRLRSLFRKGGGVR